MARAQFKMASVGWVHVSIQPPVKRLTATDSEDAPQPVINSFQLLRRDSQ
jgi:hypothetical protein